MSLVQSTCGNTSFTYVSHFSWSRALQSSSSSSSSHITVVSIISVYWSVSATIRVLPPPFPSHVFANFWCRTLVGGWDLQCSAVSKAFFRMSAHICHFCCLYVECICEPLAFMQSYFGVEISIDFTHTIFVFKLLCEYYEWYCHFILIILQLYLSNFLRILVPFFLKLILILYVDGFE